MPYRFPFDGDQDFFHGINAKLSQRLSCPRNPQSLLVSEAFIPAYAKGSLFFTRGKLLFEQKVLCLRSLMAPAKGDDEREQVDDGYGHRWQSVAVCVCASVGYGAIMENVRILLGFLRWCKFCQGRLSVVRG